MGGAHALKNDAHEFEIVIVRCWNDYLSNIHNFNTTFQYIYLFIDEYQIPSVFWTTGYSILDQTS